MKSISKITFLIFSLTLSSLVLATDKIDLPEKVELEFDIDALKQLKEYVNACSRPLPFRRNESDDPVESRIVERSGDVELEKVALSTAKWKKFPGEVGNLITREYTWKVEE